MNDRNRKLRDYEPEMHPKKVAQRKRDGHTHEWDRQSLGVIEAAWLRLAWAPGGSSFVTHNRESWEES